MFEKQVFFYIVLWKNPHSGVNITSIQCSNGTIPVKNRSILVHKKGMFDFVEYAQDRAEAAQFGTADVARCLEYSSIYKL